MLTDARIRGIKPADKIVRFYDSGGLYLEVSPAGGRWWRLKYRFAGKEKRLSLGVYPDVSLKDARECCAEAKKVLRQGLDPGVVRKEKRVEAQQVAQSATETFEAITREWHTKQAAKWVAGHAEKVLRRFELYLFPWIGARPIREITPPDLLQCLRRVEAKGAVETAHRALQTCGQVFRYALATGRVDRDPAADIRGALAPSKEIHRAAILDPPGVQALLRSIDLYRGSIITRQALRLGALTFVRPKELRLAEWAEVDEERAEWRIPGPKMKMREQHIVPLAQQALAVIRELRPLTGEGRYLFPSARTTERPMSEAAVLSALRRLGYTKDEMCGHGFRAMASTLLNENGWPPDVIERQLAHAERNKVRAAYNRAQFLPERRRMMQAWADYLDALREGRADASCAP